MAERCGLLAIFLKFISQCWTMNDCQFRLTGQFAINGQAGEWQQVDLEGLLFTVGADLCVRPSLEGHGVRADTRVRPYNFIGVDKSRGERAPFVFT